MWWGRWVEDSIKEGCVSLGQKFGFYFNCNGQSFGGFKQGKMWSDTSFKKIF